MMVVADDPEGKGCAYASKEGGGCQFTLAAHELVAFDGKHWCPFHLPMTQKTSWEEAKVETFNRAIFDFIEDANQKYRIADFTGVVFPGPISFEHFLTAERPLREIKFIGATFSGGAGFRNATFSGYAWFQNATFSGRAGFQDATFSGTAWFQNATFSSDAGFENATFSGDAGFENVAFGNYAGFQNATFSGNADFSCSSGTSKASSDIALAHDAFGHLSFENATFDGRAIFTNRKFTQPARFSGGHFMVAPVFYGCALHQGTTFLGRKFLDTGRGNVDAASAYRTLKLAMESLRDQKWTPIFGQGLK